MNEVLLWLDVETTGLGPSDHLLEVAAVATQFDRDLTPIGEPFERVLAMPDIRLMGIDPTVLEMHAATGLWRACRESMLRSDRLAGELHYQFRRWELWNGPDVYLAGRSVHFDRAWAETHFPTAFQYVRLSHRHFDLTAIKAFVALADFAFGVPEDAHRALADVQADIALARQLVELVGGKPRLLINVEEPSSP